MFEAAKYDGCGKFVSRGEWSHPDRTIDSYEIIFVVSGKVHICENGVEYTLQSNDMLLLEPHCRHFGYKPSKDTSFYWMHWLCEDNLLPQLKCCHVENPYNLSMLFGRLAYYAADMVLPEMCDYVTRLILAEIYLLQEKSSESHTANKVIEWIRANGDLPLKTAEVAEHFGYNSDYLSRLLKKHSGKNLKNHIDEAKIAFVKNLLLNTNASLAEIAAMAGFEEYKYFLKFFKYHEKMTPTAFCNIYTKTHTNNK
jgi:YesN/AraC family two-component response regulator